MLTLHDLTVTRGPETVVRGLSLEIAPGAVFWVTGPNGSGKTSLLRVLALLDAPAGGRIGYPHPACGRVLYFHSEMVLPAASTAGAWDRLSTTLLDPPERCGHSPLWPAVGGGRSVGRLSTGERKRLLLDVLVRRRGALLLDEPYEHLSPDGKAALTTALRDRARTRVVVVATNQVPPGVVVQRGIALGGEADPFVGGAAERPGGPARGAT